MSARATIGRRLGWFVLLWAGSVAALAALAWPLRWLLKAA